MFNLLDLNRSLKLSQLLQINLLFICLAIQSPVAAAQDGAAQDGTAQDNAVKTPQTARGVIFEDRDWREEGAVEAGEGVEIWQTPEVLLQTEYANPVLMFDPTEDQTITCLAEFQGKLYAGSCTNPSATDTGSVYIYDVEQDAFTKAYQVHEQGLIRLEVYGDKLYVAGYDANDGGWDLGNIYVHDGANWVEHRTVPRAVHAYGLAVFNDRIYVSADIFDEGLVGDNSQSKVALYGRVVSSGDGGLTWKEEYRGAVPRQNVGLLATLKDQLLLNSAGDLIVYKNGTWKPLNPDRASYLYVLEFKADENRLLLGTPFGLCYYDGERTWRSPAFSETGQIRGITRFGSSWIFTNFYRGVYGHGPGGTHNYPRFEAVPADIPRGMLTIVTQQGIDEDAQDKPITEGNYGTISLRENPTCCLAHRGRLFIGSHPEGRVLVLPVLKQGSFDSAVHPVDRALTGRLEWDAATPKGTSVKFQARTAPTREGLAAEKFVGPDGTVQSWYEQSGAELKIPAAGFLQYRAALATEDPARTPYLKRVAFSEQK
jgi:hypothetical protein